MRTHPRNAIHQLITAHVCSTNMYMCRSCRSCRPHPVEVFRSSRIAYIDDTDPTQAINTWMIQTPYISFWVLPLSFEQYSSPCRYTQDMREHRKKLLLFAFRNKSVAHDSVYSERSFLHKTEVQGLYPRFPLQLATPPGFHATHIPKGNIVI